MVTVLLNAKREILATSGDLDRKYKFISFTAGGQFFMVKGRVNTAISKLGLIRSGLSTDKDMRMAAAIERAGGATITIWF